MHDETKHPVTRNSEIIPGSRKASSSPNTKPTGNKDSFQLQIPQVSLPKGGGAIKSIDEKFQVNAVTGTANFSIPLPLSPSRNSFVPAIGLSYNSGNGNSIFGFGWNLDIPSITRKTEKELPRYEDANESDTFIFSGADDLVPVLSDAGARHVRMVGNNKHYSYYPRIEGNFSRVERVIEPDGNCFWQVTTKENITSIFGRSKNARIADPKDDSRIFKWLQEFSYDDKGNCYHLDHKQEDIVDVRASLHELNRLNGLAGSSNNYLKRIRYCNKEHFKKNDLEAVVDWKFFLDKMDYLLELVFDFGEHDIDNPMPDDKGEWKCRKDPFSDFRAGFEIRTYRTCKRVLMFHRFAELGNSPCLVRSMEMDYGKRESSAFTLLEFVIQTGYKKNGNIKKSLPALQFTYEPLGWNTTVKFLSAEDNGAVGVDDKTYQWMDFYGEGITGILTEQADAFYYKYNRGNGEFSSPVLVSPKPSFTGLSTGAVQLADIEANGKKFLVSHSDEGYFEMNEENEWLPFKNFTSIPNIDWSDPNLKMLDLNGDGLADILISEDDVFAWYAAKGKGGYNDHKRVHKSFDEDKGPAIVFNDITQSIVVG
jgi:hypothetical protein